MTLMKAFARGLAKGAEDVYGRQGHRGGTVLRLGSTGRDWKEDAGELHANAVVSICLNWTTRKLSQTQLQLQALADRVWSDAPEPEGLFAPLREPNDAHDETALWSTANMGFVVNGNAYWLKRRDNAGRVIGYNPVWHTRIRAESLDPRKYVTKYVYTPHGGTPGDVDPADVVHFRWPTVDPENPALGLSPLAALVRQVYGLNEAVNWEASMLGNVGWPSVIMVPKADPEQKLTADGKKRLKEWWDGLTGDRRGEASITPVPVDIVTPPFSPNDMLLDKSRNLNAADVCAALGLDPMAVHLFSENKTYSNFGEAREDALESAMLPTLAMLARQYQRDRLRRKEISLGATQRLMFDLSGFRELQEDEDKRHDRTRKDFLANLTTVGEARREIGKKDGLEDERRYADFKPAPMQTSAPGDPKEAKALALAGIRRRAAEERGR